MTTGCKRPYHKMLLHQVKGLLWKDDYLGSPGSAPENAEAFRVCFYSYKWPIIVYEYYKETSKIKWFKVKSWIERCYFYRSAGL